MSSRSGEASCELLYSIYLYLTLHSVDLVLRGRQVSGEMERRLHVRVRGASPYGFRLVGGGNQPVRITKVSRPAPLESYDTIRYEMLF